MKETAIENNCDFKLSFVNYNQVSAGEKICHGDLFLVGIYNDIETGETKVHVSPCTSDHFGKKVVPGAIILCPKK